MKPETIVRSTLDEWADEARVPAGLADRALRRRARRRTVKVALFGGTSALLAGATAVVLVAGGATGGGPDRPEVAFEPVSLSSDTSLRTDLGSAFPRRLVAAGHTAVAAYYTTNAGMSRDAGTVRRTWHLYNPSTGEYERTRWTYLSVAPGMQRAAVLQGPLPASKVGVLDIKTRKVTHWIPVDRPVGGAAWSPDGRRLLLTSYASNPDVMGQPPETAPRSGYYIVDGTAGAGPFHPLPPAPGNPNYRQDLGWSRDGTLIWAPTAQVPSKVFYAPGGERRPAPAHEAGDQEAAGLSPNGELLPTFGPPPGPSVTVTKARSGEKVAVLPVQQALAWADDDRLFAIGCDVEKCTRKNEFRNRLLLVTLTGKITPLTGYRHSDRAGSWPPGFSHR